MRRMRLFSVVIPSYNRAQLLRQAVASVLAQSYQDFELIVVDDGSTDETREVLASFDSRIRVFHQKNQGPGAARNLGSKHASGEYLAFLDSDDLWFPWTLTTYVQIIKDRGRPTLVAGTLLYFYRDAELDGLTATPLVLDAFPDYLAASQRGRYCGTCQMVVRRDALLTQGGFTEGNINAEDHDFVMRLGTEPGFVYVTAPAMIGYRQHPQTATRDLSKTFAGLTHMLEMEKAGRYPGGRSRRWERRRILAQHVRPLTVDLLRQKQYRKAWTMYRRTFGWNAGLGRFRYLAGFLVKAAVNLVCKGPSKG
jgi:glycosyltransferase involved in cell wall biosynthesis